MRLGLSILKADCCVSWIKSEPFFGKIPTLTFDCPPPQAAGRNPQSCFAGQQAGKNSLGTRTPKTLFLFDCPPPQAAGRNPQSCFAGQQAGKNSLGTRTPKTLFLFAHQLWRAGGNFRAEHGKKLIHPFFFANLLL